MSAAAIALNAVSKRYGDVLALREASISLDPGTFLVLLGPSGSGKTTLLRCLAGIEKLSEGEIRIDDRVVSGPRVHLPPDRRDLGMVFQDFALWPHMTVAENVAFPLVRRAMVKAERRRRARAMLDTVGLGSHLERYPHELSGGQQQRVALARALVARPGVLLFDEPLSALDANLRERLRVEIGTLSREHGATAVYITHDQQEAFALGDLVGVLENGQLVQVATPEGVYGRPSTPFVARFTGVAGHLEGRLLTAPAAVPGPGVVVVPTTDPGSHLRLTVTVMTPLAPGAATQVLLRPTAIRIIRTGARAALMRAVVRDGAYQGRGYLYVLSVGAGLDFTGVFDRRRFQRGDHVDIRIDPAGALAYAADAAAPAPALDRDALASGSFPARDPDPRSPDSSDMAASWATMLQREEAP